MSTYTVTLTLEWRCDGVPTQGTLTLEVFAGSECHAVSRATRGVTAWNVDIVGACAELAKTGRR